jgi:hypothetical protein
MQAGLTGGRRVGARRASPAATSDWSGMAVTASTMIGNFGVMGGSVTSSSAQPRIAAANRVATAGASAAAMLVKLSNNP